MILSDQIKDKNENLSYGKLYDINGKYHSLLKESNLQSHSYPCYHLIRPANTIQHFPTPLRITTPRFLKFRPRYKQQHCGWKYNTVPGRWMLQRSLRPETMDVASWWWDWMGMDAVWYCLKGKARLIEFLVSHYNTDRHPVAFRGSANVVYFVNPWHPRSI